MTQRSMVLASMVILGGLASSVEAASMKEAGYLYEVPGHTKNSFFVELSEGHHAVVKLAYESTSPTGETFYGYSQYEVFADDGQFRVEVGHFKRPAKIEILVGYAHTAGSTPVPPSVTPTHKCKDAIDNVDTNYCCVGRGSNLTARLTVKRSGELKRIGKIYSVSRSDTGGERSYKPLACVPRMVPAGRPSLWEEAITSSDL